MLPALVLPRPILLLAGQDPLSYALSDIAHTPHWKFWCKNQCPLQDQVNYQLYHSLHNQLP